MKVKWLTTALINFDQAAEYLHERNPDSARAFAREVHNAISLLKENPALGRPGRVFGTRELILKKFPFLIPYRVKNNTIEILRVFPTRMDASNNW